MNMRGHNENAFRLAALVSDAQAALDRVARGEADAIEGWLAYGAVLNEGRALFPSDEQFGKWVAETGLNLIETFDLKRESHAVSNKVVTHEVNGNERAAAMWAAVNREQFEEARAAGNARTVRGIHAKWKEIEAAREAEERRKQREAEAEAARKEAEDQGMIERQARAEAEAAKTDEQRQEAEEKAEQAATAKAEAEQVAQEAEAEIEAAWPETNPAEAKMRREIGKLTTEAMVDEIIGLRADNADLRAERNAARDEARKLKEQIKLFEGDSAEVIRRLTRTIEHKNSEMFRANEKAAAAMRQVYVLKKRVEELESMEVEI